MISGRGNESCPWDSPGPQTLGSAEKLSSELVSDIDNNPDNKIPDSNCEDKSKGQQRY